MSGQITGEVVAPSSSIPLASVEAARLILPQGGPALLARADELEALLRLSLGDPRTPAELASGLPAAPRSLMLARVALASGDHQRAQEQLKALPLASLTPRRARPDASRPACSENHPCRQARGEESP